MDGLEPKGKVPEQNVIVSKELLAEAIRLRREVPSRSVPTIIQILELEGKVTPGTLKRTTLQRALAGAGYSTAMMKMYQDNGWKVDPKRSRLFNKDVTVYKDTKNGTDAVTTKYRYSYSPRVEHPDGQTIKKFNSKGVLVRIENISEESPDSIDITEYDDFGNVTYVKYTVEKPTEMSYEYVYDGDKIIQGTANDLMKGEVTKWTCEYDEKGLLTKKIYPDYTYTYRYNNDGKLVESISTNTKTGVTWHREVFRYDKKTGIMLLHIEESDYGSWSMTRFWYTELEKDGWEKELDPYRLAEELPE
jgi:YD repeat-containing protein